MLKINKKRGVTMQIDIKKDKYQQQEDLLKKLKQRLEDCWSGASQVLEELEEFYYDIQIDKRLNERTRESLEQFFDYQLADIKEKAMDIQDETQNSIDNFVEQFNLNEEV
mgnify:CR=1 FL=1|jgi:hypothetical protein|tara:strand:- start:233 stop:562 length:330 start_codon:yes stop_codon:yes gene_type:complete